MICMGSGATNRFGSVLITGSVPTETSFAAPAFGSNEVGAQVWLTPAADVDCAGAQGVQMVPQETSPSHSKYLFSKADQYLVFNYLGDDQGQQV